MPQDTYLKSIYSYPAQFKQAWDESTSIQIPSEYNEINDVIISGMGGSIFGGLAVKSVFANESDGLLAPVSLVTGYDLPEYADEKTLVIATSYSGNTEETLSVFEQAVEKGCKVIVITTGGMLEKKANEYDLPAYIFDPKFNYAEAPRTGLGYVIGATFGVLSKLDLLVFSDSESKKTFRYMSNFINMMKDEDRLPVQVAQKILGRIPIFVSAEHLSAGAHIWRNFLNETSKHIGFVSEIPDMNHHFLDGVLFPKQTKDNFLFVYINSNHYHARINKRFKISREITKKAGLLDISVTLGGNGKLNELFELIIIGSLVSFNLSRIHGANPATNEMVDYLKTSLDK